MDGVISRFEEKFIPEPNSGCWLWTGALDWNGYARFALNGRNCKASRVAYLILKCEDPGEMLVLHRCDVRSCVNPGHLYLGDQKQNMEDADARGRRRYLRGRENPNRGSRNHASKLKEAQVREIKSLIGKISYQKLAERYAVATSSIQGIANGKRWGWLR